MLDKLFCLDVDEFFWCNMVELEARVDEFTEDEVDNEDT